MEFSKIIIGIPIAVIMILLAGVVGIVEIIYYAYFLHYLWNWFISPLGVMEVGVLQAAGMLLVFNFIKNSVQANLSRAKIIENLEQKHAKVIVMSLITPPVVCFVGYIIKMYM